MISVSSYKHKYNKETGVYEIISGECQPCPLCNGNLYYRNSRERKVKTLIGVVLWFLLRRLLCEGCGKLHTELPDIIQPYKHYDSATIQSILDGSEDAEDCVADNSTMYRWKKTYTAAEPDIIQRINSVYSQEADSKAPIIAPGRILETIKSEQPRWLSFVMRLLINNGHKICTQFAFCLFSSTSKMVLEPKNKATGGEKSVKTIKDTS